MQRMKCDGVTQFQFKIPKMLQRGPVGAEAEFPRCQVALGNKHTGSLDRCEGTQKSVRTQIAFKKNKISVLFLKKVSILH